MKHCQVVLRKLCLLSSWTTCVFLQLSESVKYSLLAGLWRHQPELFSQTFPTGEEESQSAPAHANDEPGAATTPEKYHPNQVSHEDCGIGRLESASHVEED